MANERIERRLAAVLAADVAGYSRLMGADEIGTLEALKAHRREVVDPAREDPLFLRRAVRVHLRRRLEDLRRQRCDRVSRAGLFPRARRGRERRQRSELDQGSAVEEGTQ